MHETFDFNSHWVSEQIENGFFGISHPILVSVLKFSLLWDILAISYTFFFWDSISASFLYASILGLLWVNLAPYLIWYYDERVLPEFFAHVSEIIPDENKREKLAKKYNDFFAEHRLSVSIFWTIATVTIIYTSQSTLLGHGMTGTGSIFLWITYGYAVYVGAVLGHGFVGPITTILLVREITQHKLEIDPLHPDNLGGLSTVGFVSIRTTLLFSSGSLFLPLLFYFSSSGGDPTIIYGFAGVYILTILASFIYPTTIVNKRAQEYRDSILDDLRQQYANVEQEVIGPDDDEIVELNKKLELQRIRNEFENYNSVSLYPLQFNIITRLIGSIILPILFMVIEIYLPNLI